MDKSEKFEGLIEGNLWSLLFHYNHYTKLWACFNNEDKENYFNGGEPKYIIGKGQTPEGAYQTYSFCNKKRNINTN
jgi:hypothetical protein